MDTVQAPEDWNAQKQKSLMDFMMPDAMRQGIAMTSGGSATPPVGGGLPPVSPPVLQPKPETEEVPDESKTADSHPAAQPSPMAQYVDTQEKQVDKWGPDKQAALMQNLQQGYKSPGNLIAKGGATLADAIMQGVARAGTSGNLSAINERENQQLNRAAEMGKSLQEQNLKARETKQGLESLSGTTPLGGTEAKAAQFMAKQLFPNISQAELSNIAQNPQALAKFFPSMVEFKKALAEIENTAAFRQATLAEQKATLANTEQHERTQEGLMEQGQELQHPILTKLRDFLGGGQNTPQAMTATNPKTGHQVKSMDGGKTWQ